jgi:hemerythrin-like domain-containing protein
MDVHRMAEWMREEHNKVEELTNALRERASVVPRSNLDAWIDEVRERFEHFRAHLTKHMALEEHEGYMKAVVQRRPALSDAIDRLEHEHVELLRIMDGLKMSLAQIKPEDRLLVRDCCRRIESLLQFVEHHEADENLMMVSAFTNDIGTKD